MPPNVLIADASLIVSRSLPIATDTDTRFSNSRCPPSLLLVRRTPFATARTFPISGEHSVRMRSASPSGICLMTTPSVRYVLNRLIRLIQSCSQPRCIVVKRIFRFCHEGSAIEVQLILNRREFNRAVRTSLDLKLTPRRLACGPGLWSLRLRSGSVFVTHTASARRFMICASSALIFEWHYNLLTMGEQKMCQSFLAKSYAVIASQPSEVSPCR